MRWKRGGQYMKVYVIRHGESEANRSKTYAGWAAVSLSRKGHAQAKKLGEIWGDVSFDRVYSSDLLRARQTAHDVLPNCEPILSDKLRELNVGVLQGTSIRENELKYGETNDKAVKYQDFSAFGGESSADIRRRVFSFMQELEKLEGVERVAVFGHEGTVHQMIRYVLGCDMLLEHLQIDNTSCTVLAYENGVWRLVKFNSTDVPE